jgi:transcriptional regulator with XRE-family HTH domain
VDVSPALLDAARRGRLGDVIRLARRRLGMTQAELAAAIGYSQAAVSRIERGTGANAYDIRTLRSLAGALDIPASLLGISDPPAEENEPVHRRDFLRVTTAVAAMTATGDLLDPHHVGQADVAEIQQAIDDLRALDQRTGGDRLHHLAAMQVRHARSLLARGSYGPDVAGRLSSVLGEAAILSGWLSFDAGRHEASQRSYAEAVTAAGAASDELVAAHAYANMSMLTAALDQPQRAVQYAQAGQRAAARRGGPRLRALLCAREAQAHAGVGDHQATSDALRRADRAFHSARGNDPGWTAFFTEAELAGAAGSAFRALGSTEIGVRHLQDATNIPGRTRNRASWVLQLAAAHAVNGAPEQACAVATEALPVVTDLASTRVRRLVHRLSAAMTSYGSLPEVRDFRERATALGLAS